MAAVEEHEQSQSSGPAVPERLSRRLQSRQEDAERRREAKQSLGVPEERAEFFTSEFHRERAAVEELLSSVSGPGDRAQKEAALERAAARTARLQKFVSDSVAFLPQYELRQAQAALQRLHSGLSEARDTALPKKKFTFSKARSRATEKPSSSSTSSISTTSTLQQQDAPHKDKTTAEVDGRAEPQQSGFSHLSDVTVSKTAAELEKRDVLLSHLRSCRVRLYGSPSSLTLSHIQDCEIRCGPVSSSVFVDHCRDSVLVLACQQLRTHHTERTRVFLHVTSRAILEDCSQVAFAPFTWDYPGLDRDFRTSGLDRATNNWSQVDDFNWLSSEPSPNWSLVPEEERAIPEEERAIPEEERAIPEEERAIPEEERAIPEEERAIPEEERAIPEEERVIPEEERVRHWDQ